MAKIFISYAHEDDEYKKLLYDQLSTLGAKGIDIEAVSDSDITPGSQWKEELERYMDAADAGVLLLSTSFLKSEWCRKEVERLRSRKVFLLPVMVRACDWTGVVALAGVQGIIVDPDKLSRNDEGVWLEIAREIRTSVERMMRLASREGAVPTTLRKTKVEDWEDEWDRIRTAVEERLFTPILGPGCYEVKENTARARSFVRARLGWIQERLGTNKKAKQYLEGIVASNLKGAISEETSHETMPNEPSMRDLIELQACLARLGAACCDVVGKGMQERPCGFTDVRAYSISIDQSGLRDLFFEATQLAAKLYEENKSRSQELINRGLGARGILEQLVMLTYMVFYRELGDDCDRKAADWKEQNDSIVSAASELLHPGLSGALKLSLSQLEWLAELLWHTIRFEAPMYPSPEDLSFQLSVCLDRPLPPRREKVSMVAEFAGRRRRVDLIRRWYQRYASGAAGGSFYKAITRALCYSPSGRERGTARRPGSAGESSARFRQRPSLVVTTNFDLELERAFDQAKSSYHVLYPVCLETGTDPNADGSDLPTDWLLRTVTWDSDGQPDQEDVLPDQEDVLLGKASLRDAGATFVGPLIVKLHGSPLHTPRPKRFLSGPPFEPGAEPKVQHRISLSDSDFIKAITERDKFWPPNLDDLLHAHGRVLCFLGYPLRDADSRLRLSQHLRGGEQQDRTLYLVDFPVDALRQTLLKRIRVDLIKTTIEKLTSRFSEWLPES